jgi:hypothetical protein
MSTVVRHNEREMVDVPSVDMVVRHVELELQEMELLDSHLSRVVYFSSLTSSFYHISSRTLSPSAPPSTTTIRAFILAADVLFVIAVRAFERVDSVAAAFVQGVRIWMRSGTEEDFSCSNHEQAL